MIYLQILYCLHHFSQDLNIIYSKTDFHVILTMIFKILFTLSLLCEWYGSKSLVSSSLQICTLAICLASSQSGENHAKVIHFLQFQMQPVENDTWEMLSAPGLLTQ